MSDNQLTNLLQRKPRVIELVEARERIENDIWGKNKAFSHYFLCSVSLPHRRLDPLRSYQKTNGNISLSLQGGLLPSPDPEQPYREMGIPYGSKSKLLLLLLQSRAVLTNSPTVEVGDNFTDLLRSMKLCSDTRSIRAMREQIDRMSCLTMRLTRHGEQVETFQAPLFSSIVASYPRSHQQRVLFSNEIVFSDPFFRSLREHSVPLRADALFGGLSRSSMGIDIYCWLASRLFRLKKPQPIRWTMLKKQFSVQGSNGMTADTKSFKRQFSKAMKQCLMVYPEARVEEWIERREHQDVNAGFILYPSRPTVLPREVRESRQLIVR
jgi:hypothetical protein